jgi:putative tryptophan/tyrosine transport system permease protein
MSWFVPIDIGLAMGLILAWAVVALALAFRLYHFPDLTIEGSLPLGAAVFAALYQDQCPWPVAVVAAFAVGALAGALTAVLHVKFRINKFLAGILVVAICYSLSLRLMGASNIGLLQFHSVFDSLEPWDKRLDSEFHLVTLAFLGLLIATGAALVFKTLSSAFGMNLRAAGSNPEYARALGIDVLKKLVIGLALTNGLAALSGVLLAMKQGFADVGMGQGILILALAAMTIGERIMPSRSFSMPAFVLISAIFGSVLYQILVSYAVRAGLAPTDLKLATAVLVLLVIALRVSRNGGLFEEATK